jgi:hypothetical protein
MSLNATTISAAISGSELNTFGAAPVTGTFSHTTQSNSAALSNGTGNGQAQVGTENIYTVSTSGTTIDLTAVPGGFNGSTRNYSILKGIIIENLDPTNTMIVSPGAANGWAGINGAASGNPKTYNPGGYYNDYDPAGLATIASSSKTILVKSGAGSATIKVTAVGVGS